MRTRPTRAFLALIAAMMAGAAHGELASDHVRVAVDVNAPVSGTRLGDDAAASVGALGASAFTADLAAALPNRVAIDAFFATSNRIVFSSEVDFQVGGSTYRDEDLVAYNPIGSTFAMYFDGSAVGLPASADLDAATLLSRDSTILLLSFEVPVRLPSGTRVRHNDVVQFDGASFTLAYSSATLGIPARADIDALHSDGNRLFFSLDVASGNSYAPAVAGNDEDVWRYVAGPTVTRITGIGIAGAADLVGLDEPVDRDGDWLSDFEEATGKDEAATTFPGRSVALSPGGRTSSPFKKDTDGDGQNDGAEAACGTSPTSDSDYLRITKFRPNAPGAYDYDLDWSSVPGKKYEVRKATDLKSGFTTILLTDIEAAGGTSTGIGINFLDPKSYYRVYLDLLPGPGF